MKRKNFKSQLIQFLKLLTSHSPPPQCSTSTPCYIGTEITTPPFGGFLLSICSRHARSTKIRFSAFQKDTRQRHLKSKGGMLEQQNVGMTSSPFLMIFCREASFHFKKIKTGLCKNTMAIISPSKPVFTYTLIT